MTSLGPLVSVGKVLRLDGRGMVISNLASSGNSGGPVLDKAGRVVGVVYTAVRQRQGVGHERNDGLGNVARRSEADRQALVAHDDVRPSPPA